jgi:hypothetical protein
MFQDYLTPAFAMTLAGSHALRFRSLACATTTTLVRQFAKELAVYAKALVRTLDSDAQ